MMKLNNAKWSFIFPVRQIFCVFNFLYYHFMQVDWSEVDFSVLFPCHRCKFTYSTRQMSLKCFRREPKWYTRTFIITFRNVRLCMSGILTFLFSTCQCGPDCATNTASWVFGHEHIFFSFFVSVGGDVFISNHLGKLVKMN